MNEDDNTSFGGIDPEETELWEAIQEAKDDKFVRPNYPFDFNDGGDNEY